jgi:hypothetical protein
MPVVGVVGSAVENRLLLDVAASEAMALQLRPGHLAGGNVGFSFAVRVLPFQK